MATKRDKTETKLEQSERFRRRRPPKKKTPDTNFTANQQTSKPANTENTKTDEKFLWISHLFELFVFPLGKLLWILAAELLRACRLS